MTDDLNKKHEFYIHMVKKEAETFANNILGDVYKYSNGTIAADSDKYKFYNHLKITILIELTKNIIYDEKTLKEITEILEKYDKHICN